MRQRYQFKNCATAVKYSKGHRSMKQMKQVYNYSRNETWTPEPEVSFRESLFCINLCHSQKRGSWGLISHSENIVWLPNHTSFLNFWICNRHPGTRRLEEEFLCFRLIAFRMVFEFKLILRNATERFSYFTWPQIHTGNAGIYTYTYIQRHISEVMQNIGTDGGNYND